MKSSLSFALAAYLIAPALLQAEDWTTTDGKVYQNVTVVKAEPDAVTITDREGGARVPLANLSPELQKRFNYDPVKAKAAATARAQDEAKNAAALQAEMNQARDQKQANLIASDPRVPHLAPATVTPSRYSYSGVPFNPMGQTGSAEGTSETSNPTEVTSATEIISSPEDQHPYIAATTPAPSIPSTEDSAPATSSGSEIKHHSMDELVDVHSRLKDDHPSPNRHTAASLLLASQYLMPDPLDPKHHSTDDLIKSASDLSKPTGDNTHSRDSAIDPADPLARP